MKLKQIYKSIKNRGSVPTTAEEIWEHMTEQQQREHGGTREIFLEKMSMYHKIMNSPEFTYEGAAQSFGITGKVICGFPGVGKSTLFKELKDSDYKVLDSDSSTFPKGDFPDNYIKHIKEKQADGYTILASSHDAVRDALIKENMMFTLVYPDKSLKDEYLKRYADRGSPESFIKLLDSNWDKWISQCDDLESKYVKKVKLSAGEFIDAKKAGLVTKLKESEKTIKTQKEMISDFKEHDTTVFKKTGSFDARKGKSGEHIVTTIDGEDETKKTVKDGEIVVKGPKGEMYVISETKFRERYEVDNEPTDSFQKYKTKGLIRAYEYNGNNFKFMASWDEEMICKDTDYLATPVKSTDDESVSEVYRIERSVFDETYTKVDDESDKR